MIFLKSEFPRNDSSLEISFIVQSSKWIYNHEVLIQQYVGAALMKHSDNDSRSQETLKIAKLRFNAATVFTESEEETLGTS